MIATWMMAAVMFTLCVGVAAAAAERLIRASGRSARGVWAVALAVTVTWPVLVPVFRAHVAPADTNIVTSSTNASTTDALMTTPDSKVTIWSRLAPITRVISVQTQRLTYALSNNSSWLNPAVLVVWIVLSGVLLLRLFLAVLQVQRLTQHAMPAVIDDTEVLLAEGFGPASVGWRVPRVVVPQWVLVLDSPLRALVLRHEVEHCRTRDPRFVWCAAIATAVMPWNVGLWWLARRLRLALELDCDVRTLQHGGDPRTYAKLLLFMTQQHAAPAAHLRLASSLAASRSHLATRIKAMQDNSMFISRGAQLAAVCVGALALIGAGATRIPDAVAASNAPLSQVPAVLAVDSTTINERARDTIYFEYQVEKPASMRLGTNRMVYPEMLRAAQVEGVVLASFVVNEQGVADMSTFKVLKSDHDLFTAAVRAAVPNIGYIPAEIKGERVKQLVQQPFVFNLARTDADAPAGGVAVARRGSGAASTVTARAGTASNAATPGAVINVPRAVPGTPVEQSVSANKFADVYFEFQVEKPAAMRPGQMNMVYPPMLRSAEVEGTVLAQFVVDEFGVPDVSSFKVIRSDHDLFTHAVRTALAEIRYLPAEVGDKKVKQLMQQPFVFSLAR